MERLVVRAVSQVCRAAGSFVSGGDVDGKRAEIWEMKMLRLRAREEVRFRSWKGRRCGGVREERDV